MSLFQSILFNAQLAPSTPADQTTGQTDKGPIPAVADSFPLLDNAAAIIQMAFWILVGTLSLLTYLHARRTFFQPLKTEVFKLQLAALTSISECFHGKGEVDLCDDFALDQTVAGNSWAFLDSYAYLELHAVSDLEEELMKIYLDPKAKISHSFQPVWQFDDSRQENKSGDGARSFDGLMQIGIPKKQIDAIKKIESLNANPLIPDEISKLVEHLLDVVHQNVMHIHTAFEPLIPRMAEYYPDIKTLNSTHVHWLHNKWNKNREPLEPAALAILMKIREYYQPDLIGFAKKSPKTKSSARRKHGND